MKFKAWFWNKIANFKYRKIPYGICCCGSNMDDHPLWDIIHL